MPGHLIRRVHQQAVAAFSARTAGCGLTPVQYAALRAIRERPGVDQVGVGRAIAYDKATVGEVLDRLQAKELIVRIVDPRDRRARRLQLTAAGEALLKRIEPAVRQAQADLLEPLDAAEAEQLLALLARIAARSPDE